MPSTFNALLTEYGLDPGGVKLLRHQAKSPDGRRTPYTLWRDEPEKFEQYISFQNPNRTAHLRSPFWANFVVSPERETLFAGLYAARLIGIVKPTMIDPITDVLPGADVGLSEAAQYNLTLLPPISPSSDKIVIDWGAGKRAWIQRADKSDKKIIDTGKKGKFNIF